MQLRNILPLINIAALFAFTSARTTQSKGPAQVAGATDGATAKATSGDNVQTLALNGFTASAKLSTTDSSFASVAYGNTKSTATISANGLNLHHVMNTQIVHSDGSQIVASKGDMSMVATQPKKGEIVVTVYNGKTQVTSKTIAVPSTASAPKHISVQASYFNVGRTDKEGLIAESVSSLGIAQAIGFDKGLCNAVAVQKSKGIMSVSSVQGPMLHVYNEKGYMNLKCFNILSGEAGIGENEKSNVFFFYNDDKKAIEVVASPTAQK